MLITAAGGRRDDSGKTTAQKPNRKQASRFLTANGDRQAPRAARLAAFSGLIRVTSFLIDGSQAG